MEIPEEAIRKVKEVFKMQQYLTNLAWLSLYEQVKKTPEKFTDDENNFIVAACEESSKTYENWEEFFNIVINDHAGLALMQAGMSDMVEKIDKL